MAKTFKRTDFDVLVPPQPPGSGGGGEGPQPDGVQFFDPNGEGEKVEGTPGKKYAPEEPSTGSEKKKDKSGSGEGSEKGEEKGEETSGKGSGGDSKELKPGKPSGSGAPKAKSTPLKGGNNVGGMIDPEASKDIQEAEGVPVELPSDDETKKMIDKAWKNIDKLKPTSSRSTKGGSGDGSLRKKIAELHTPKVDWRAELKRYIGKALSGTEDYMGARRHIHTGTYITGERSKFDGLDQAIVAVDVSGSVMGDFPEFITEVAEISKARQISKIHVCPFAHTVRDVVILKKKEPITPETFANVRLGGGTEAIPEVVKYAKNKVSGNPAFCVILTDGWLTNGLPKPPVWGKRTIWVIFSPRTDRNINREFKAPPEWGRVIYVHFASDGTW